MTNTRNELGSILRFESRSTPLMLKLLVDLHTYSNIVKEDTLEQKHAVSIYTMQHEQQQFSVSV